MIDCGVTITLHIDMGEIFRLSVLELMRVWHGLDDKITKAECGLGCFHCASEP